MIAGCRWAATTFCEFQYRPWLCENRAAGRTNSTCRRAYNAPGADGRQARYDRHNRSFAPPPASPHLPVTVRSRTRSGRHDPTRRRDRPGPVGPADCCGPGNGGNGRKRANQRDLPKLWDFLIRARLASRWKKSAEPNGYPRDAEPRFPGRRPGGIPAPAVRPDPHDPACPPRRRPRRQDVRAPAHPQPPCGDRPGAVGPPAACVGPHAGPRDQAVTELECPP
jgi:hypothetical protein